MFKTLLIASALALSLSGGAMAREGGHGGHGHGHTDDVIAPGQFQPDQTVTGSIFGPSDEGAFSSAPVRPYEMGPCSSDTLEQNGAPNVNDHYCGK